MANDSSQYVDNEMVAAYEAAVVAVTKAESQPQEIKDVRERNLLRWLAPVSGHGN